MSQSDSREVGKSVTKKRRFDKRDFQEIAAFICDEHARRRDDKNRKEHEKAWKEIDRQLRMEPDVSHKMMANGQPDKNKAWMPEMELPLQAQTLEILTADARRMMFPDAGPWFTPHAALTDEYLDRVDFQSIITGDENEVPSRINQDNADKLVHGILSHWHRQYDFAGHYDQINAEAFKYGTGIGRARLVTKRSFVQSAQGMSRINQKIPVLFPRSIKDTFLDDRAAHLMNEGHMISPAVIAEKTQKIEDLRLASNKGGTDPDNEDGGWMPENLKDVEGDKHGDVKLLEYEGDLVVPRKTTRSMYLPNVIATVVIGKNGDKSVNRVIRFRFKKMPFSSYLVHPYHVEHLDTPYATSPLMKGMPIQKAAADALNRVIESAALNNQPPIGYDKDDGDFAASGGPRVYPGAQWATTGDIKVHDNFGDPTALFQVYAGFIQQYADVTGVNAPRLGAQTVSHTTAFAKEAEMSRGTIRTVDYVRSTLKSPTTKWLQMAYLMGREAMKEETVYIDAYNGYVTIDKDALPDKVVFDVHGSGGPAEEQAKSAKRMQALQMAIQIEQMAVQAGEQPSLDLNAVKEQVLREGGWTDIDTIIRTEGPLEGPAGQPGMGANPGLLTATPGSLV